MSAQRFEEIPDDAHVIFELVFLEHQMLSADPELDRPVPLEVCDE